MGGVEVCDNTSRYSQGPQNCNTEYHKSAVNPIYRNLESIFLFFLKSSVAYTFSVRKQTLRNFPLGYDASHSHCAQPLRTQVRLRDILGCHLLCKKSSIRPFVLIFHSSSYSLSHFLPVFVSLLPASFSSSSLRHTSWLHYFFP